MTMKWVCFKFAIACAPAMMAQQPLDLSQFRSCIAWNGGSYGSQCWLAPNTAPGSDGVWDVDSPLEIGRSVEVIGTNGDATDVVLRRSTTLGAQSPICSPMRD